MVLLFELGILVALPSHHLHRELRAQSLQTLRADGPGLLVPQVIFVHTSIQLCPKLRSPRSPTRSTWATRMTTKLTLARPTETGPSESKKGDGEPPGFQPVGMVLAVLCVLVLGNLTERLCRLAVQFFDSAVQPSGLLPHWSTQTSKQA